MRTASAVNPPETHAPALRQLPTVLVDHLHNFGETLDRRAWLAQVRVDQLRRWQRRAPCPVEAYLEHFPRLRDDEGAILDLIYNEVVLREECGETADLAEYQRRFPELAAQLPGLFEAHAASCAAFASELPGPPPKHATLPPDPQPTRSIPPADTPAPPHSESPADAPQPTRSDAPPVEMPATPRTPKDSAPRPMPTPVVGQTIAGYEILGELGRGGMGVVYKARQTSLKRLVALKMILGTGSDKDRFRFQREAEAVARLQHPNIVQVYEVGEEAGQPFFSLEYIDGGSLDREIDHVPQPAESAARLSETLARAMHVAHQAGIVHRDLKPANILLRRRKGEGGRGKEDGEASGSSFPLPLSAFPLITDFGLAKQLEADDGQTVAGAVMGTPSYMAPEQAEGLNDEVGPLADVYALGAILYELLTGRPPFLGPTPWITVGLVLAVDPVPPRQVNPQVPVDLETICLKCLEKDRNKRYGSAEALADDLRRYLNNEPIQARPTPASERLKKWVRRNPARAAAYGFLGLIGVLCFLYLLVQVRLYQNELDTRERLEIGRSTTDRARARRDQALGRTDANGWKDWEEVVKLCDEALGQLLTNPYAADLLTDLKEEIRPDAVLALSWRDRHQRFLASSFQATLHETPISSPQESFETMKTAAGDALAQFGIQRDSPRPVADIPERYFTAKEREEIQLACRGLVLLLAEAEARPRPDDTVPRQQRLKAALAVLTWAANAWPPTRSYYLQRADYLTQLGRAEEAEKARQTAPKDPVDVLDRFRLGVAHFDANQVEAAMQEFRGILSEAPQHFWSHYRLALCQIRLAEEAPEGTNPRPLWEAAETHLTDCLRAEPHFAWALVLRGHVRSEMGQMDHHQGLAAGPERQQRLLDQAAAHWQGAEEDLSRARRLHDPTVQYALLTERGLLRYRRGSYGDAEAELTAARKLKPEWVPAYTILASVYAKQNKRAAAITLLDQAIAQNPKQAAPYRTRAGLHRGEWNWEPALKDIEAAIRLEAPGNTHPLAGIHVERAQLLLRLDRPREAVDAYGDALRVWPPFARAYRERGQVLERLGDVNPDLNARWRDYEAARLSLDQYADLPGKPDHEFYRARALLQKKQVSLLSRALSQARAGGAEQAEEAEKWSSLLQTRLQGLVADYGRAIELRPTDPAYHAQRGWELLLLVDAPKLAMPDFKRAIELREAGNSPRASDYAGRGLCRVQFGQWPQAVADAEKALKLGLEKDQGRELTFLHANVARIYAQAAGRINLELPGRGKNEVVALTNAKLECEKLALKHLKDALDNLEEAQRLPFWREAVRDDPGLATIRSLPKYQEMDRTYGGRGK